MPTQFRVPQWTTAHDPNARRLTEISHYTNLARGRGLADTDIGVEITLRWPDTVPGGVATAVSLAAVSSYVSEARSVGLSDDDIGNAINVRWPGLIPGGAEVATDDDGVSWVTSTRIANFRQTANRSFRAMAPRCNSFTVPIT